LTECKVTLNVFLKKSSVGNSIKILQKQLHQLIGIYVKKEQLSLH